MNGIRCFHFTPKRKEKTQTKFISHLNNPIVTFSARNKSFFFFFSKILSHRLPACSTSGTCGGGGVLYCISISLFYRVFASCDT